MNVKRKGNAGELELLHILEANGIPCYRNTQEYVGGLENPDIFAIFNGKSIHVEVKRRENLNLYDAIAQAVHDANGKALPVVAHRKNRKEWLVTIRLDDLLSVAQK